MVIRGAMAEALKSQMADPQKRSALLDDATLVLDKEVKAKGGVSGMAIKGAFKVVTGARPGFTRHIIDRLLDDFLGALDPLYQRAIQDGLAPGALVVKEKQETAEALLEVADRHVQRSSNEVARKAYDKLRGSAGRHVAEAAPALAALLDRHASRS